MQAIIRRALVTTAFAALLFAALPAQAQHHRPPARHSVPEFDPASVGAITALLVGGGVLVARRRRR